MAAVSCLACDDSSTLNIREMGEYDWEIVEVGKERNKFCELNKLIIKREINCS